MRHLSLLAKKQSAFSIVEVLVSAAIFSLVILLIFGTYVLTLKLTRDGRETSVASNLVEQMVDAVRATPFDDITLDANPTAVAISKLPGGLTKTYVSLYENNDKIKEIKIDIYWDHREENRAISLTTLITQGGLSNVGLSGQGAPEE